MVQSLRNFKFLMGISFFTHCKLRYVNYLPRTFYYRKKCECIKIRANVSKLMKKNMFYENLEIPQNLNELIALFRLLLQRSNIYIARKSLSTKYLK